MNFIDRLIDKIGERVTASDVEKAASQFTMESLFLTGNEIIFGSGNGIEGAYNNSWVAYSCIKRLGTDAAGVPLKFLRDPKDMTSDLPDSHPTVRLFRNPNPYFTTGQFIESIVTMLQLRGEFFIIFDDPMRPSSMMQYTEPLNWRPIMEGPKLVGWEYRNQTEHYIQAHENMITHRFIDPAKPYRGQPPIRAAAAALNIDIGADMLQQDIVERGGERSVLYTSQQDVTPKQRQQALTQLKARRKKKNTVGDDVLLPNGVGVIDPKFIEDDLKILASQSAQPDKICAVYGLSKSLLGIEDIDKYATFAGRIKVYFYQTLMPQLRGIEDAFDGFFVHNMPSHLQCYVRFDYDNVPALQENIGEQFEIAGKAHKEGLPWTVLDNRFRLGLELEGVPGADQVLVNSMLAPIDAVIDSWREPAAGQPSPDRGTPGADEGKTRSLAGGPGLTNALIEKRARDPRLYLQRKKRLFNMEKDLRAAWKVMVSGWVSKAGTTASSIEAQRGPARKAAIALVKPYHEKAALEGEVSILELVQGKIDDQTMHVFKASHKWRPGVEAWFTKRQNRLVDDTIDDLFDDVKKHAISAVKDGKSKAEVTTMIKGRFNSANGGINRAITIAKTEVGSAYNFARFAEMKGQDFPGTKWLTSGSERVRGNDANDEFNHVECNNEVRAIDKKFPCGLRYPMEEGADAGNAINCECESIPTVEV